MAQLDLPVVERKILAFWKRERCFEKLVEKNRGKPRWSFLDGPITANNPMGVHHAWGRTYKDVFQRFHAMNNRELRYQNGFDCQGLWVEVEVERELGFQSKRDIESYGVGKFVDKCKERARKYAGIQTEQSIRLGYWMDWDNSYYTMSDENNYTIWQFLKKCHQRGFIYHGLDCMPWCPRCGTGLSQHEIHGEDRPVVVHDSPTVRLPILGRDHEYLLIWTTTPWTLTSNVACAVHPERTYAKVRQNHEIYYLIEERVESIMAPQGAYEILERFPGARLLDFEYDGPFDDLPAQAGVGHRVIPWKEVSAEEGTGIVHIAPGCGKEDYQLGREHDLPAIGPIDESGIIHEGFGRFTGENAAEIAEAVFEELREKSMLYRVEAYQHAYPICWRCKTQLLFRLVDEWYISMDRLREEIKEVTRQTDWIPAVGRQLETEWLDNMSDWMISKKRYWGLALPIYRCADCDTFEVIGGKEELRERAVEGWERFDGNSPHRPWVDEVKIEEENRSAGRAPRSTTRVRLGPLSKTSLHRTPPIRFQRRCIDATGGGNPRPGEPDRRRDSAPSSQYLEALPVDHQPVDSPTSLEVELYFTCEARPDLCPEGVLSVDVGIDQVPATVKVSPFYARLEAGRRRGLELLLDCPVGRRPWRPAGCAHMVSSRPSRRQNRLTRRSRGRHRGRQERPAPRRPRPQLRRQRGIRVCGRQGVGPLQGAARWKGGSLFPSHSSRLAPSFETRCGRA
ncbi:MAG: class I tRNA ligase family protein [Acidobacteria bacterium]|nr:class I tRNA ligase family protein [Acidobacteriota bacterium]